MAVTAAASGGLSLTGAALAVGGGGALASPALRVWAVPYDLRTLTVPAEDRTLTVPAEDRTLIFTP